MDSEIQLINDGDGVAVIGDPKAVELFLAREGLPSKDLGLPRLGTALGRASGLAQTGSEIAASSGRWVQLTEKSARALHQNPNLMKGSELGVSRAVLMKDGKIKGLLEIANPGKLAANPALLAGAAGLMAQLAMQQTMDEIIDYLAKIDEKVDDILRAQKDAVLADVIGVGFVIDEAMAIREEVGRVSEVTWSKVQVTPGTIARTQAYAIGQLDALADKLEKKSGVGELAEVATEAEAKIQEWLAVLARCFQLQDAIAVLELDRVLDASPEELDQHRIGLRNARQRRLELISRATERLLQRMAAAAGTANAKVLFNPTSSRRVVHANNRVSEVVVDFHSLLGLDHAGQSLEAREWLDAATEMKDKALSQGAEGVDTAMRFGNDTLDRAKEMGGRFSSELAERKFRLPWGNEES